MNDFETNKGLYKIFIVFALFWAFLCWLGFILALLGFFYKEIFIGYLIIGGLFFSYWKIKNFKGKLKLFLKADLFYITLVALVVTIVFSSFVTPTIFSGRDQGSISEAAIRLAQNHKLEFSTPASKEFFEIYGPGKALNFPGFHYTNEGNLITQFPLPYISWLAIFYSIFGLLGLKIANAILFYVFILSFIFLARLTFARECVIVLTVLTLTSFSFSWFIKFTLSENLALALLWSSILSLVLFTKKQTSLSLFAYLSFSFLLVFTRIEGLVFLIMGLIILVSKKQTRVFIRSNLRKYFALPLLILIFIFLWNFSANIPFYKEIAKALINNFTPESAETVNESYLFSQLNLLKLFFIYGIVGYLFLGIIGIIYILQKKKWQLLIPFILVLPSFFYLVMPSISSDHPWMLRRFIFSILPVLMFYSVFFLGFWSKRNATYLKKFLAGIAITSLLVMNLPSFQKYTFFSENEGLLEQITELSYSFSDNDLILVSPMTSGDNWSMISGPMDLLTGKNAVYFFNPKDLEKINLGNFDNIFFIASGEEKRYEKAGIVFERFDDYLFETKRLEKMDKVSLDLPDIETVKIDSTIFKVIKQSSCGI